MPINNHGLQGQPTLPYTDNLAYAGVDQFIQLAFLDYTGAPQTPLTLTYEIDDLTNGTTMVPVTSVTPTGSTQIVQIVGSKLVMTYPYIGSQICQIVWTAIFPDGTTSKEVTIIELCAIQTPSGT